MSDGSERVQEYYRGMTGNPFGRPTHSHHYTTERLGRRVPEPVEVSEDWADAFGQAVNKITDILAERQEESTARLHGLEEEVKALKQQLAQGNRSILVLISTLAPDPYILQRKVQVLVLPDDGSFVATLVDANINASGETVPEAIANLKDMMISLFERLNKEPKEKLGKWPARQLGVLQDLIRRKARHAAHQQTTR